MNRRYLLVALSMVAAGCAVDDAAGPDETEASAALVGVTVGTETPADAPIANTPTGYSSRAGSVAFSGAQYLATWQDLRTTPGAIYGARLSTLGAVTDTTNLRISPASIAGEQAEPVVVFSNNRYIVVWEDRGANDLRAAAVTPATGAVTQLGTFGTAGVDRRPRVAVRGSDTFVVYEAGGNVFGSLLVGTSFAAPVAIATTADVETQPAVSANPAGGYLVTYTVGTNPRKLFGQRVAPAASAPLVGGRIAIGNGQYEHHASDVSFVGSNFVVVWTNGDRIAGSRVSPEGVVLDTHLEAGVAVGGIPLAPALTDQPRIACSTNCFLTYRRRMPTVADITDVEGRLYDAALAPAAAVTVVRGGLQNQSTPAVTAAGTNGYFATYFDTRHGNDGITFGTRIVNGATADASGIQLARGNNYQGSPMVARAAQQWSVVWTDSRVLGNNILGGRVNNGGQSTDPSTVSGAPFGQGDPALSESGTGGTSDFMVVWSDRRSGQPSDIYGTLFSAQGTVVNTSGTPISTAAEDQARPRVATNAAGGFFVVWQDRRTLATTKVDIYGAVLNGSGAVVQTDIPISRLASEQLYPVVRYDAVRNVYLVAWIETGTNAVQAVRVTTAGAVLDATPIVLAAGSGSLRTDLSLAYGSDRFFAVWREGVGTIRGVRAVVTPTTITPDAAPVTISTGATVRKSPVVAYMADTSRRFLVVWADARNAATTGFDLYAAAVFEPTGGLDPEAALVAGPTDELSPSVSLGMRTTGNSAEQLLTYQRYDATAATHRVYTRKLSY